MPLAERSVSLAHSTYPAARNRRGSSSVRHLSLQPTGPGATTAVYADCGWRPRGRITAPSAANALSCYLLADTVPKPELPARQPRSRRGALLRARPPLGALPDAAVPSDGSDARTPCGEGCLIAHRDARGSCLAGRAPPSHRLRRCSERLSLLNCAHHMTTKVGHRGLGGPFVTPVRIPRQARGQGCQGQARVLKLSAEVHRRYESPVGPSGSGGGAAS